MKRILKKMSFLGQWKFLKSVNHVGVRVLGQGCNSCRFNQGAEVALVCFLVKPQQISPIICGWEVKWFLPKLEKPQLDSVPRSSWQWELFRTSLSCGHHSYREESMRKGKSPFNTSMYFPVAVTTNYDKFGALKQQKLLLLFIEV